MTQSGNSSGNFNAWLNEPSKTKKAQTCQTCAYGDKITTRIRDFLIARSEGRCSKKNIELHEYLVETFDYHLGESALSAHMRRCEKELYGKKPKFSKKKATKRITKKSS